MTYSDNYSNERYPYFEQYPKQTYTHSNHHIQQPVPVKVEANDSPSLHTAPHYHQQSLAQFSQRPNPPVFRFGDTGPGSISSPSPSTPNASFTFMSSHPWPSLSSAASASSASSYQTHQPQYASDRLHSYSMPSSLNGHSQAHSQPLHLNDDYDDGDDDGLADLPPSGISMGMGSYGGTGYEAQGSSKAGEKAIRRRSSKACDQCRKSKCKCERSSPQEPCRNCVMLGTACTFLGPSRKRGPPKGYIDAIEARLHQTEALIGILLSSKDSRAKTLLADLSEDSLAKEIINRVNNSPYGYKGRNKGAEAPTSRSRPPPNDQKEGEVPNLQSTHPSNEWQDQVTARINSFATSRNTFIGEDVPVFGENEAEARSTEHTTSNTTGQSASEDDATHPTTNSRPVLSLRPPTTASSSLLTPRSAAADRSEPENMSAKRQRRRLEGDNVSDSHDRSPSTPSISGRSRSPVQYALLPPHPALLNNKPSTSSLRKGHTSLSPEPGDGDADIESAGGEDDTEGEDELAVAVGQLSINEDEQVRYHGKASGLHLLGIKERVDGRNEGGIWRFPKARVWPPLPATARTPSKSEEDWTPRLPDVAEQEHLLELYFTYVHPALPILHKKSFMENYRHSNGRGATPTSPTSPVSEVSSPATTHGSPRRGRITPLLLLAMFSIAARYSSASSTEVPPPEEGSMWAAGDSYLEGAKVILDNTYSASMPSTCQALLLLGYREVGIGAMAQAWLYIGMAVRMAQDLGLHRNAEKWSNIGKNLFTSDVLQERQRIWYGCVIMDKYVSSYIGRPVAIFENDFDTELPSIEEPDEMEEWAPHPSAPILDDPAEHSPRTLSPTTGHVVSCFNESAKLSILLSMIIQIMYPIRRHVFRLTEFSRLEKLLDKWYLELPEHLRFDPASSKHDPLTPHVLTLHLQYWCTVILLHRPFIHKLNDQTPKSPNGSSKDVDGLANPRRNYDMCAQAANHITTIVSVYVQNHCTRRASVFLCYYVFTAAIMHVTTLTTYPSDPQASIGLHKCMDTLKLMQSVWPSAWRANQLLRGSKVHTLDTRASASPAGSERNKRTAERLNDDVGQDVRISGSHMYRQSQNFARPSNGGHPGFPLAIDDLPSTESPTFFQSFDRWAPDNSISTYPSSLSTSVLPQQYSTGLMDERSHRPPDRPNQRYPQYWSDYGALGQMETTYGVPLVGGMVPQNSAPSRGQQPVYSPDHQYSVFNNLPSGSQ